MAKIPNGESRNAFRYPSEAQTRRHGPQGYRDYRSYKPWLRDDFAFRCVYCLWRERWCSDGDASFAADHLLPQTTHPSRARDYGNLVYTCVRCNCLKRDQVAPLDPCERALGEHMEVRDDGAIRALTPQGAELIEVCRLSRPKLTQARGLVLSLIRTLQAHPSRKASDLLRRIQGYPGNLPDLASLRPPGGNTRPGGVATSHAERRRRGALPEVY